MVHCCNWQALNCFRQPHRIRLHKMQHISGVSLVRQCAAFVSFRSAQLTFLPAACSIFFLQPLRRRLSQVHLYLMICMHASVCVLARVCVLTYAMYMPATHSNLTYKFHRLCECFIVSVALLLSPLAAGRLQVCKYLHMTSASACLPACLLGFLCHFSLVAYRLLLAEYSYMIFIMYSSSVVLVVAAAAACEQ